MALAVSKDDGHTFQPHPAGALINVLPEIGCPGSVSSKPFVEVHDGIFRMWFSFARRTSYHIHYAESTDGIRFKWLPDPVLDVVPSGWDRQMNCYPFILHLDSQTLMYYDGDEFAGIGVAELV